MAVSPKRKNMIVASSFSQFKLGNSSIQFVNKFIYIGHIITQNQKDDDDIEREIRNNYVYWNKYCSW